MSAARVLESIFVLSKKSFPSEAGMWRTLTTKVSSQFGAAYLSPMLSVSQLDLMLRQIEADYLAIMKNEEDDGFVGNMLVMLSESWLLAAYEIIRGMASRDPAGSAGILKKRLALARIPVAKAEIEGADAHKKRFRELPNVLLGKIGCDGTVEPTPYAQDGSYVVPRAFCTTTGSLIWQPIDLKEHAMIDLRRRDLADEFLCVLD
ncbi:hypothetical protein [Agrobacterium sp.]|uniref:hypothetical protein n=1 Tax=Agrobacterium sp. TaxID=361 RepID=UPI00289A6BEC|nr:hypothetical protein [Agrobacterium sp.]